MSKTNIRYFQGFVRHGNSVNPNCVGHATLYRRIKHIFLEVDNRGQPPIQPLPTRNLSRLWRQTYDPECRAADRRCSPQSPVGVDFSFPASVFTCQLESPRVCWRLHFLRRWSHEKSVTYLPEVRERAVGIVLEHRGSTTPNAQP